MKFRNFLILSFLFSPVLSYSDEFRMNETELKNAISIIYEDVLNKPYMVDPVILEMKQKVKFYLNDDVNKYEFFKRYFENMNIKIFTKNGVDYLKYVEPVKIAPKPVKVKGYEFVYKPKYRSVAYLSELLSGFLNSSLSVNDEAKFKGSINNSGNMLIVHADKTTIDKIKGILPKIDVRPKQIVVTARLLEVKKTESSDSGLRIISNLLKNKLSISLSSGSFSDDLISIKTGSIQSLFSIFDTETRFNVISSPILRVMDSETGNFTVGSDVPTLGAETVERDGSRTRDINYRSAGVIFNIKPTITEDGIRLNVKSELSDFTKTETGVNGTPTLLKRFVDTTVYVGNNNLIILGGLSEEKSTNIDDSFFKMPSWLFGKSRKFEKSDILLLLHTRVIDDPYKSSIDLDKIF